MTDLLYPNTPAPLLFGSETTKASELLPVVDINGNVVAQASRQFVHAGTKPLHPVVHLHIINRNGDIYLQKRAAGKKVCPNMWDTAVGGHISYGEQVPEALYREAAEELGFYDFHPICVDTYVFESKIDRELINVFAAVGDFTPVPDHYEVTDGRYWTPREIRASMGKGILTPNFESEYKRIKSALEALL